MKKIFTLLAVSALAASASAADVYSWSSVGPEATDVTEFGGVATYENGDGNRVNYPNTANGVTYYTLSVNGKKGNMGDAASANAGYIQIALDQPAEEGYTLELTGYLNKDSDAIGTVYALFKDAAMADLGDYTQAEEDHFPNLNPDAPEPATAPGTVSTTLPAGTKYILMTRSKASTNVFLTVAKVTKEGGEQGGEQGGSTDGNTALCYWPVDAAYGVVNGGVVTDGGTGSDNFIQYTNGIGILLDRDDKSYSAAKAITIDGENYTTIKLSNGATNILTAPEGTVITKLVLYSYINYNRTDKDSDGRTCYWAQVGETNYTADDAQILQDYNDIANYTETPDRAEFSIPNLSSVVFKNTGEQLCFVAEVTYQVGSAVNTISSPAFEEGVRYNLQGVRVDESYKGLVIMNGKKVLVK